MKIKDILSELSNLFDTVDNVKKQCGLDRLSNKMRVMVTSSALKSPISTRLLPSGDMSARKILAEISKVLQSNEDVPLDRSFSIDVVALKGPRGSGKSLKVLDYSKDCKLKRCITTIRNVDNLCCARALAVGIAMAQGHSKLNRLS